jgi:hypothetical protein
MKDYRASDIGHTGPTGGNPYLDHVLMYSLIDKEKDNLVGLTGATGGSSLYSIGDIKLSVGLDLSVTSSSSVTSLTDPGTIYSIPNPDYDSDLREEINLYYPTGATGLVGPTGDGSFYVTQIASTYPWPVGRSQSFVTYSTFHSRQLHQRLYQLVVNLNMTVNLLYSLGVELTTSTLL